MVSSLDKVVPAAKEINKSRLECIFRKDCYRNVNFSGVAIVGIQLLTVSLEITLDEMKRCTLATSLIIL